MAEGSVYIDAHERFPSGNIMVAGRLKIGQSDQILATDLNMKQVTSFQGIAWNTPIGSYQTTQFKVVTGSIGSLSAIGSGNYVRVRQWRLDSYRAAGTVRTGTTIGTSRLSYIAWGR